MSEAVLVTMSRPRPGATSIVPSDSFRERFLPFLTYWNFPLRQSYTVELLDEESRLGTAEDYLRCATLHTLSSLPESLYTRRRAPSLQMRRDLTRGCVTLDD